MTIPHPRGVVAMTIDDRYYMGDSPWAASP
jgi:hypothetical protein